MERNVVGLEQLHFRTESVSPVTLFIARQEHCVCDLPGREIVRQLSEERRALTDFAAFDSQAVTHRVDLLGSMSSGFEPRRPTSGLQNLNGHN